MLLEYILNDTLLLEAKYDTTIFEFKYIPFLVCKKSDKLVFLSNFNFWLRFSGVVCCLKALVPEILNGNFETFLPLSTLTKLLSSASFIVIQL